MDETFEFDDTVAVEFIHNNLPQELKEKFSDDMLYYILDLICEFYEKKNFLTEEDEETEERELISFIVQQAKKDKIGDFLPDDILLVLRAESAYTDTLNIDGLELE